MGAQPHFLTALQGEHCGVAPCTWGRGAGPEQWTGPWPPERPCSGLGWPLASDFLPPTSPRSIRASKAPLWLEFHGLALLCPWVSPQV